MALIKCKECGAQISSTAANCPHCGYTTEHGRSVTESKALLIMFMLAIAAIVVGLLLFIGNFGEMVELYERIADYGIDYLGDFIEYGSDEKKAALLWHEVGTILMAMGIATMVNVKKRSDAIDRSGRNGFIREKQDADQKIIRSYYQTQEKEKSQAQKMDRWECTQCHHTNPPVAQTCTRCGTARPPEKTTPAEDTITCPECGDVHIKGTPFCTGCGTKL